MDLEQIASILGKTDSIMRGTGNGWPYAKSAKDGSVKFSLESIPDSCEYGGIGALAAKVGGRLESAHHKGAPIFFPPEPEFRIVNVVIPVEYQVRARRGLLGTPLGRRSAGIKPGETTIYSGVEILPGILRAKSGYVSFEPALMEVLPGYREIVDGLVDLYGKHTYIRNIEVLQSLTAKLNEMTRSQELI